MPILVSFFIDSRHFFARKNVKGNGQLGFKVGDMLLKVRLHYDENAAFSR